jgi:hypothetical protein
MRWAPGGAPRGRECVFRVQGCRTRAPGARRRPLSQANIPPMKTTEADHGRPPAIRITAIASIEYAPAVGSKR